VEKEMRDDVFRALKQQVDQMVAAGDFSAPQLSALIGGDEPDVDLLLYVAEHPGVAEMMVQDRVPDELEAALIEAFSRVMPQLGMRAFGPPANLSRRTRARLDAERRKYELVAEHVGRREAEPAAAVALLRNYLLTEPAPLYAARLSRRWPELMETAEREHARGAELDFLVRDRDLFDALVHPAQADAARVSRQLAELSDELPADSAMADATLKRAMAAGSPDAKLAAAALATFGARTDLIGDILGVFLSGASRAPQFAVMAARLAPLMARNAFAQFLVDVAGQNPEEPEAKITAERTHTILSARGVLPLIGSPLAEVRVEEFPDTAEFAELRLIPDTIAASWELWEQVLGRSSRND
jgi:hypothetical protein